MESYVRRVFEGESPCDRCNQCQKCQSQEIACRAFCDYVLHGTFSLKTARIPTSNMFNKIFKEDDKALKNYLKSMASKR
jgi:hypothetical protein